MNPLLSKVTGIVQESDVVPVPGGALTRRTFRDRMTQQRQQRRGKDEDANAMRRVVGEAQKSIIPDKAEEIDDVVGVLPKKMNPIKDVVQEPSYPSGDREKLMTPYAALTAPDATPEGMTPIDPSKIPGHTAKTFTAGEVQKPAEEVPVPAEPENPGMDRATRAMDVLLGRKRTGAPAKDRVAAAQASAITTEAAAYAALNIPTPGLAEAVGGAMVPGKPMPPPTTNDAQTVCNAFRKFVG